MTTTRTPALLVQTPLDGADPLSLAAYNQNFENFRALNALMWQIPLIAMTLTGGLWFGVSSVPKDAGPGRSGSRYSASPRWATSCW